MPSRGERRPLSAAISTYFFSVLRRPRKRSGVPAAAAKLRRKKSASAGEKSSELLAPFSLFPSTYRGPCRKARPSPAAAHLSPIPMTAPSAYRLWPGERGAKSPPRECTERPRRALVQAGHDASTTAAHRFASSPRRLNTRSASGRGFGLSLDDDVGRRALGDGAPFFFFFFPVQEALIDAGRMEPAPARRAPRRPACAPFRRDKLPGTGLQRKASLS